MALIFATTAAVAFSDGPSPQTLAFDIRRHDETIGRHVMVISQRPGRVEVTTDVDVKVSIFGLTAYRFTQRGSEIWEHDRLKRLSMVADDDGTKHVIEAEATAGGLRITADGKTIQHAAIPPATLWHPLPATTTQVLDPADGTINTVTVRDLGLESVSVRGQPVQARHWRWVGEYGRDVWYDAGGRLVQVYIRGDDGSDIFYVLK
ncbi:hypothetical protein A6A04_18850 [Paramagnetospirillum marisnigri]|uniref:Uncharacterized protein n=1 Tax=Paramagnetospirillum marisnigri TaxID=1285242 RepID=A0A178MP49_9PROT|nr:hypothetical protein A6A04_18850 [Paramagnetospirillum marisnigri]